MTEFFAPNFFNFKIILALSIFENDVAYKVFTFTFRCAMPRRALVDEIGCPPVKEYEALDISWWDSIRTITAESNSSTTLQTGNTWDYASDGYQWVHKDGVLRIPPGINNHLIKTLTTPKGYPPITVSLSINGST